MMSLLIVIPACDEEETIASCLTSIRSSLTALTEPKLQSLIVIVCDNCRDRTAENAEAALQGTPFLISQVNFRNVGKARDHGIRLGLLAQPDTCWIACTDADSQVHRDWLLRQVLAHGSGYDAYMGRVSFPEHNSMLAMFRQRYRTQEHRAIHGANMGFSHKAYFASGGIPHLPAHEDCALVDNLEKIPARICWDQFEGVETSVRLKGRAPEGFAKTLQIFAESCPTVL